MGRARNGTGLKSDTRALKGWAPNGTGPKWDALAPNGMGPKWDGPEMTGPQMAGPKWSGPKWRARTGGNPTNVGVFRNLLTGKIKLGPS